MRSGNQYTDPHRGSEQTSAHGVCTFDPGESGHHSSALDQYNRPEATVACIPSTGSAARSVRRPHRSDAGENSRGGKDGSRIRTIPRASTAGAGPPVGMAPRSCGHSHPSYTPSREPPCPIATACPHHPQRTPTAPGLPAPQAGRRPVVDTPAAWNPPHDCDWRPRSAPVTAT